MNILTLENKVYELDKIPDILEDDIRFSVLDNSDPSNPDFFFVPLIFLESFNSPAIVLNIGGFEIAMPVDWHIAIGCSDAGVDVEVIPLTSLNDRGFEAFCFNPLNGFKHSFKPIEIVNVYSDVKWYFPKVRNNQLITTPINDGKSPECVFFIKEISRQSELIDYARLL
jgi:hypothetical protein